MVVRSYEDECSYIERINSHSYRIKKGFQPNMNVEGVFYVNSYLEKLMFDELRNACRPGMVGGFLPGVKQEWIPDSTPTLKFKQTDLFPCNTRTAKPVISQQNKTSL